MQLLKDRILRDGIIVNEHILKVDTFINHQIDPALMMEIGLEFTRRFANTKVTKVLTIESSGIAPALLTAYAFKVPMIFGRKRKSLTLNDNLYSEKIYSFTKQEEIEVSISKKYIHADDHVLVIDDFLAHGEAALGMARLVDQAGAQLAGIGILIEKSFQTGRKKLEAVGYRVESLVRIQSLANSSVCFEE